MRENTPEKRTDSSFLQHGSAMSDGCMETMQQNEQLGQTLESGWSESTVFPRIALSLARGYADLYYVNMETDEFIEYHTDEERGVLTEARRGSDFFEGCERDAKYFVHPDDQAAFVEAMNRQFLENALDQTDVFELVYRRIKGGAPFYVRMKVTRMQDDKNFIVLAVSDIDELMRQRNAEERMIEERIVYARLHALTGNFICVYVVDPETERYHEFSSTSDYEKSFAQAKEGANFFDTVRKVSQIFNYPGDVNRFLTAFTKENVMAEVERNGIFTLDYRFMMNGRPLHCQLKAAMVEEREGPRLIVGLNDIDAQVRRQEEFRRRLARAQTEASIDALTGVKNKHAYLEAEAHLDRQIEEHSEPPFAISILDINDLKLTNDTLGHQAGDQRLRDARKIICKTFQHSPVFRVGGDEFAVISQGDDYERIEELVAQIDAHNAEATCNGGVVVACGMSKFDGDACVATVFERADRQMYENKNALKSGRKIEAPTQADTPSPQVSYSDSDVALPDKNVFATGQYDYLTGLPAMTLFFDLAEAEIEDLLNSGCQPMLLYINFDGMKFFNNKYGFAEGDIILQSFAQILVRMFGISNSCRIGADHFAAIAEKEGLEDKLNAIFQEFGKLYDAKTPPVHVGIYPYQVDDVPISSACDRAKGACGNLSGTPSSGFAYYSAKLREATVMKQYIIENLDSALRERRVEAYVQPIIRAVSEKVCDVETLARWIDPEKGALMPDSFIPALEESGLIYKLDLYMVERVLEFIKEQISAGLDVVPHSINLSRADFDACDIVEEIRQRVDAAGVRRDLITIEITESVIGNDFDFMKKQIERFQKLGFPVWMDDFGSGYSSLDALQSIQFDLIKFDQSFMRRLDEGENGKIILTELMRMATSLGVDTVCEGVETESQALFLQEIGCSKLQGYFYCKPVSFETIRNSFKNETLIETENPAESEYYESMGRVNLYDLDVIAQGEKSTVQNTFDTLPMGVIEIKGDSTRFVRSNQSYRDFIKRFFGFELSRLGSAFAKYDDAFMRNVVKTCCEQGLRSFYDEKMPDGSIVHSFARRISTNPITGDTAIAVAVLSISEPDESTSYADIARALAADYYSIYIIDMDTDRYVEYSSLVGKEDLALEGHGESFFEAARRDAMTRIYEKDRALFLSRFTKENVVHELDEQGAFTATYRLIDTGTPIWVNMKATRMQDGNRLILGISVIDAQMKQRLAAEKLRQERVALGRIAALSENYIALYVVDPVTGQYTQYNPSNEFKKLGLAKQGTDFFADVRSDAPKAIHPDDIERHLSLLTKENLMREIRENGQFGYGYRLLIDGKAIPTALKATLVEEEDGEKIILGVSFAD